MDLVIRHEQSRKVLNCPVSALPPVMCSLVRLNMTKTRPFEHGVVVFWLFPMLKLVHSPYRNPIGEIAPNCYIPVGAPSLLEYISHRR